MTVHLLRTPEYDLNEYNAVYRQLKLMGLVGWNFVFDESAIENDWETPEVQAINHSSSTTKSVYLAKNKLVSWDDLFAFCHKYRSAKSIPASAIVILLTSRHNELNWFSAFDQHKNAFIHTADWEKFISCPSAYPIAYEVLANSLQMQMELDLSGHEPCVHEEPIGCMNDLCVDKRDIALKLRTADICLTCLERLQRVEIPSFIVDSTLTAFDKLRKQMLFRQGFRHSSGPLLVDESNRICFPEQGIKVKMPAAARAVYLLFLRNPTGFRLAEISDYRDELWELYKSVSHGANVKRMETTLANLTNPLGNSLNEHLSRIRNSFIKTIGEAQAKPYLINGTPGDIYRINHQAFPLIYKGNPDLPNYD